MASPTCLPLEDAARPAAPVKPGIVLFALAMGGFAIGTTEFAAMALVPYFSPDLGVSEAKAAEAISAYALGVVVGAPTLAVLGATMSRRILLIWLMLAFALFNTLSALSPDFGTMLLFRFLSGLPHGAYFGVAALVAASVVPPNRRSAAVARLMMGLTVATTLGVPFANVLGQTIGWRFGFGIVGVLATATAIAVFLVAPRDAPRRGVNPLRELDALKSRQVWLILATGAIGFGGFFAVYTYLASTVIERMPGQDWLVPAVLMLMGAGMTLGALIAGWASDRNQEVAGFAIMGSMFVMLMIYPVATNSIWTMLPVVLAIGATTGLSTVLQTRLMDVAGEAQTLAAALNHSAFNVANALGPWLAAEALRAGHGFASSGYVGAAVTAAGILIFAVTVIDGRRRPRLG